VATNSWIELPVSDGSGGGGVTSLNSLVGDLTLVGGAGIVISPSGAIITISSTGFVNPMTSAGDIIYGGASGLPTRLGTNAGVLVGGTVPSYSTSPTLTGTNFTNIPLAGLASAAYSTTATASTLVERDANSNVFFNGYQQTYNTTALTGTTIVLTNASGQYQAFTGSAATNLQMPVASTMQLGQFFELDFRGTAVVTLLTSSGATLFSAVHGALTLIVTCVLTSGTTSASWEINFLFKTYPLNASYGGTGNAGFLTGPAFNAYVAEDANGNFTANNFLNGFATTVTSGGSTTLVISSKPQQNFTGTANQTVVLPVASTLVNDLTFTIVNQSTGVVTVNSSGGNTLQVMAPNTQIMVSVVNTAGGTGTASWTWVSTSINSGNTNQTTLTGSAGTAICSQPLQSSTYKKVLIYLSGYTDTGTQSYTYPTAFTQTPLVSGLAAGVAGATASTTAVKFTVTTLTGFVIVEGY